MDQVLWVGKGAVGRVGLWEGGVAEALFADAPEAVPASPPTCPFHPTFLSRSAPASDLAVIEVRGQCMHRGPALPGPCMRPPPAPPPPRVLNDSGAGSATNKGL